MATPVDPVFILLPIFDEARMKVTLCVLVHCYFMSDFGFSEMLRSVLKLSICRKVKILESSGKWMRFYLWKDILDINICCHLQKIAWKSFVKLKVNWLSMVCENNK